MTTLFFCVILTKKRIVICSSSCCYKHNSISSMEQWLIVPIHFNCLETFFQISLYTFSQKMRVSNSIFSFGWTLPSLYLNIDTLQPVFCRTHNKKSLEARLYLPSLHPEKESGSSDPDLRTVRLFIIIISLILQEFKERLLSVFNPAPTHLPVSLFHSPLVSPSLEWWGLELLNMYGTLERRLLD